MKSRYLMLVVAALLIAGSLVAVGLANRGEDSGIGKSNPDTPVPGKTATVLIDGWSWAALSGATLSANISPDGTSQTLRFSPISDEALGALAKSNPREITYMAARMLSAEPSLKCTESGCKSASASWGFSDLVDVSSGKAPYSDLYQQWGVHKGVMAASVRISDKTSSIVVNSSGWGNLTLYLPLAGDEPEKVDRAPAVFSLGAAYGRLFELLPNWIDQSTVVLAGPDANPSPLVEAVTLEGLASAESPMSFGSAQKGSVAGLNAAQLTLWSSPTSGCAVGTVCAPGKVAVSKEKRGSQTLNVCTGPAKTKLGAVIRDEIWSIELPHAIAQAGAWNAKSAPTPNAASLWYPGAAPLVEGKLVLHEQIVEVYSGTGQLYKIGGQVSQVGVDPAPSAFGVTEALKALGPDFTRC